MFNNIHFEYLKLDRKITKKKIPLYFIDEEAGVIFIPWLYSKSDHVVCTVVYKHKLLA